MFNPKQELKLQEKCFYFWFQQEECRNLSRWHSLCFLLFDSWNLNVTRDISVFQQQRVQAKINRRPRLFPQVKQNPAGSQSESWIPFKTLNKSLSSFVKIQLQYLTITFVWRVTYLGFLILIFHRCDPQPFPTPNLGSSTNKGKYWKIFDNYTILGNKLYNCL